MSTAEFHLLLVLLFAFEARQHVVHAVTSSFSIKEGEFSCGTGGNLLCSGNATTTKAGALNLTPDPPGRTQNFTYYLSTVGVALYKEPIQLVNLTTNEVVPFSISFSLRIESDRVDWAGDGMALVMLSDPDWIGSSGGSLGAFSLEGHAGVKTLAVEFDTHLNSEFGDPGYNHVGIDIASATSETAKQITDFDLVQSTRVFGWVDYDSTMENLEIRIDQSDVKPEVPFITLTRNLLDVFGQEQVWIGFSGSNGRCTCYNFHTVYDLSFNHSYPVNVAPPPPASDPAQNKQPLVKTKKSTISRVIIAAVVIAALLLGSCVFAGCFWARRRRNRSTPEEEGSARSGTAAAVEQVFLHQLSGFSHSFKMFSYEELCMATDNFNSSLKLGEGGFGGVYRGKIPGTEQLVAVKKVSSESRQGEREFIAEVSTISQLRHRNVVELLGWCSDGPGLSKYLLVYEFMPNGSLDNALFSRIPPCNARTTEFVLSWEGRFKVLEGLAAALNHLHNGWRQRVIHRDVKASNIMLDDKFNAMLGDFGLARISDHSQDPATTAVAGTQGYIAPEASLTGKYNAKTDVFSFGAVVLEVVCGRKIYDIRYPADEILLVDWVWAKLSEDEILSVVDSRLGREYNAQQVENALHLGLLCCHPKADERPPMHRVMEILSGSVEMPSVPKSKPEVGDYHSLRLHRRRMEARNSCSPNGSKQEYLQVSASSDLNLSSSKNSDFGTRSSNTSALTSSNSIDSFQQSYVNAADRS